jgi:hypothetical protein
MTSDNGRQERLVSRSGITPETAARMELRSLAFGEATSRPAGKPWNANTYGRREELSAQDRKAKARAVREHEERLRKQG